MTGHLCGFCTYICVLSIRQQIKWNWWINSKDKYFILINFFHSVETVVCVFFNKVFKMNAAEMFRWCVQFRC